jgi:hypothetical protein
MRQVILLLAVSAAGVLLYVTSSHTILRRSYLELHAVPV